MNKKNLLICTILFLLVVACNNKQEKNKLHENPEKILSGMFTGVLPCADCPGIATYITFGNGHTVAVTSLYQDREKVAGTLQGTWEMKDNLVVVSLPNDSLYYRIQSDSTLMMVNSKGEQSGSLADKYILTKQKPLDDSYFAGDYLLEGDTVGYTQKLTIKALSDKTVNIDINFSGSSKGCTFSGNGKIINDQIEVNLHEVNTEFNSVMIIRPISKDHLFVSTARFDDRYDLNYFCGGGGSLAGEYIKVER